MCQVLASLSLSLLTQHLAWPHDSSSTLTLPGVSPEMLLPLSPAPCGGRLPPCWGDYGVRPSAVFHHGLGPGCSMSGFLHLSRVAVCVFLFLQCSCCSVLLAFVPTPSLSFLGRLPAPSLHHQPRFWISLAGPKGRRGWAVGPAGKHLPNSRKWTN